MSVGFADLQLIVITFSSESNVMQLAVDGTNCVDCKEEEEEEEVP